MTGPSDSIDESGPLAILNDKQLISALELTRDVIQAGEHRYAHNIAARLTQLITEVELRLTARARGLREIHENARAAATPAEADVDRLAQDLEPVVTEVRQLELTEQLVALSKERLRYDAAQANAVERIAEANERQHRSTQTVAYLRDRFGFSPDDLVELASAMQQDDLTFTPDWIYQRAKKLREAPAPRPDKT